MGSGCKACNGESFDGCLLRIDILCFKIDGVGTFIAVYPIGMEFFYQKVDGKGLIFFACFVVFDNPLDGVEIEFMNKECRELELFVQKRSVVDTKLCT